MPDYFERHDQTSTIVVAPDVRHAKSAARFTKNLGIPVAAGDGTHLGEEIDE